MAADMRGSSDRLTQPVSISLSLEYTLRRDTGTCYVTNFAPSLRLNSKSMRKYRPIILNLLLVLALSSSSPAIAFSLDLGGGYNRLLSEHYSSMGWRGGASWDISPHFSVNLGASNWYYSVVDDTLKETTAYSLLIIMPAMRLNLGRSYFSLGPSIELDQTKTSGNSNLNSSLGFHGDLGWLFPFKSKGAAIFVEADAFSSLKLEERKIAGVIGIRFGGSARSPSSEGIDESE